LWKKEFPKLFLNIASRRSKVLRAPLSPVFKRKVI
jgi:hypothetical protein